MLLCVVLDRKQKWDVELLHVAFACHPASAVTGLTPNEIRLGRLLRFPLVIVNIGHTASAESLERNQFAYFDLIKDHQNHANEFICKHRVSTTSRITCSYAIYRTHYKNVRCTKLTLGCEFKTQKPSLNNVRASTYAIRFCGPNVTQIGLAGQTSVSWPIYFRPGWPPCRRQAALS